MLVYFGHRYWLAIELSGVPLERPENNGSSLRPLSRSTAGLSAKVSSVVVKRRSAGTRDCGAERVSLQYQGFSPKARLVGSRRTSEPAVACSFSPWSPTREARGEGGRIQNLLSWPA